MSERRLQVAVIGCGQWGPNHVRVFTEHPRSRVIACADPQPARFERIRHRLPSVTCVSDYRAVLSDDRVDAVVVATPTYTHAEIVAAALRAGKHVLSEKPLTTTAAEARALMRLADHAGRVLMVGHVFLFNNGIIRLRDMIAGGALGRVHYLDAVRTNLGPVRDDVNALYDLGAHDVSIFNFLLGATPIGVSATGARISQDRQEDVCFATLRYADGTVAHVHVSWLNPRKVRTLTVVGARRMAHWDDVDPSDTLRIYDKGFDEPPAYNTFGEFQYILRSGDVHIPALPQREPLLNQAEAFIASVLDGAPVRSGAAEAAATIEVLEAANWSLANEGRFCPIPTPRLGEPRTLAAADVTPIGVHGRAVSRTDQDAVKS